MKKARKLEEVLPVYKVEHNAMLSKQGDITIAFEITLPEIFTLSTEDFEAVHQAWGKAIRVLPINTILHKQDWFTESAYKADFNKGEQSFLSGSSERFFNERPYLNHQCFLFITKKPDGKKLSNSLLSNLIRPTIVPAQTLDPKLMDFFLDKAGQFAKILEDSGFIQLRRLVDDELASIDEKPGILERYCYLLQPDEQPVIRDISIGEELKIGDLHCQLFTLADVENLPSLC